MKKKESKHSKRGLLYAGLALVTIILVFLSLAYLNRDSVRNHFAAREARAELACLQALEQEFIGMDREQFENRIDELGAPFYASTVDLDSTELEIITMEHFAYRVVVWFKDGHVDSAEFNAQKVVNFHGGQSPYSSVPSHCRDAV